MTVAQSPPMLSITMLSLLPALVLCGCSGVGASAVDVKSIKASDYTKVPRTIVTVMPANSPLDDQFKSTLSASFGACGTVIQFVSAPNLPAAKASHIDAMLTITPLGEETRIYMSSRGDDSWLSKARFEFALIDVETEKNVWKEQVDFTSAYKFYRLFQQPQSITWAEALFDKMKQDGLTACAAGTTRVQPPAPVVAIAAPVSAPEPPMSVPASIIPAPDPISAPAAVMMAAVPPPPIVKPAAQPSDGFIADGATYPSADEALRVLRQAADRNLAQASPAGASIEGTLLLVLPDPELGVPMRQSAEARLYAIGQREIRNQAYARVLRRLGPFKSVTTVRAHEIRAGEFRGAAFRLSQDGTDGAWSLASAKGGEQRLDTTAGETDNELQSLLNQVHSAAESLPH